MSTPTLPANTTSGSFQVLLGGTLAGNPQPPELFYPLRCDQFLTLRDGEMSEARAVRDLCLGAFVAAVVGITGLVALINWDAPLKQQKVAFAATAILAVGAVAAVVVAWVQQRHIVRTRTQSAYSRLVETIGGHFSITDGAAAPGSRWVRFLRFFGLRPA
jgi:hypothetical protein